MDRLKQVLAPGAGSAALIPQHQELVSAVTFPIKCVGHRLVLVLGFDTVNSYECIITTVDRRSPMQTALSF